MTSLLADKLSIAGEEKLIAEMPFCLLPNNCSVGLCIAL